MDAIMSAAAITVWLAVAPGAQEAGDDATKGRIATATEAAAKSGTFERTTQATVPPVAQRRERRGTKGGYIEDAMVTSQVRIRFDAGFGINAPDRAEFFYAKCGCYVFDPVPWFDPDAPGPGSGVPTELNFQQLYIQGDYLVAPRLSLFAELPWRAIQPQGFEPFEDPPVLSISRSVGIRGHPRRSQGGSRRRRHPGSHAAGPQRVSNRKCEQGVEHRHRQLRARLAVQPGYCRPFRMGGSNRRLVPLRRVGRRAGLRLARGLPNPNSEKFSGNVIFYGIGPNFDLVRTDSFRFTPVLELVGWRVIGGAQTLCPNAVCPIAMTLMTTSSI